MAKYTIGKIWLHVVREGELYWGIQQKNCIKIDNGVDNEFKRIQFRKWPSKKKSSLLIFGRAFFTAGGSRWRWLAWWSAASALTSSNGVVTLAQRNVRDLIGVRVCVVGGIANQIMKSKIKYAILSRTVVIISHSHVMCCFQITSSGINASMRTGTEPAHFFRLESSSFYSTIWIPIKKRTGSTPYSNQYREPIRSNLNNKRGVHIFPARSLNNVISRPIPNPNITQYEN